MAVPQQFPGPEPIAVALLVLAGLEVLFVSSFYFVNKNWKYSRKPMWSRGLSWLMIESRVKRWMTNYDTLPNRHHRRDRFLVIERESSADRWRARIFGPESIMTQNVFDGGVLSSIKSQSSTMSFSKIFRTGTIIQLKWTAREPFP